jgi:hypothetical protein
MSENQTSEKSQQEKPPVKEVKPPFKIGIIVNETNLEDISYYNEQFKTINKAYKDRVELVFIGYKKELDYNDVLHGVKYKYVKPVSVIHYPKQLKALEIDLLFVPLINNIYNASSENVYKMFEAATFNIPTICVNIAPYNTLIGDKQNGFLYESRETFFPYLRDLLSKNFGLIKLCGQHANTTMNHFNYSAENAEFLSSLFPVE